MKSFSILAAFAGLCMGVSGAGNAAYPAYPSYQAQMPTPQAVMQNRAVVPTQNNIVTNTVPTNAAQPTRVTGALPRVGTQSTTAGRQYYQPADYDRLADSGLYIGLSVGYSASVMGSIEADYSDESTGFLAPGAFQSADFDADTVIPLQLSVGAAINNDIRVDFSYTRYSSLGYPSSVATADGAGGFVDTSVDGGAITANATMLNIYYNIDSYTGYLAGGMLRPYIGAGVGLSLNTLSDYVVYDGSFYSEAKPTEVPAGYVTGVSDIYAYHNGGTEEQLAFMLEGGLTTELDGGLKLDFFVRYANLGKVKTSGSVIVSQTEWYADGNGGEYADEQDKVFHYTNWTESGRLSLLDVGIRLRLQF